MLDILTFSRLDQPFLEYLIAPQIARTYSRLFVFEYINVDSTKR